MLTPKVGWMDEQELIECSQNGDLESFNRLVESYQGQVYNLAFRMLRGVSAEDATQEAFISAFRHIRSFRGGSFKAWLLRIATNACYDQMRSGKRRPSISLDSMLEEDPAWEPASKEESPEDHALRAELSQELSVPWKPCSQSNGPCWSSLISKDCLMRR